MDIADYLLCLIIGFLLLCIIRSFFTWESTVVVMFFWLCYKFEIIVKNQMIITTNQNNLEKLIRGEIK